MALELVNQSQAHQHYRDLAIDATTTSSGSNIDVGPWPHGCYQVIWSGIAAGAATYEIQVSLDGGVTFDTVTGTSSSTSGAAGSASESFTNVMPGGLLRLKITATTGTAGTIDFYLVAKEG